jgi:hypothetical protein
VRGSVVFGSDWTWSIASDTAQAISFDPGGNLAAVPFTAWRRSDRRYAAGAEIIALGRAGATTVGSITTDGWVERAVFVDGRLVTIGPEGVRSFDYNARPRTGERRLSTD